MDCRTAPTSITVKNKHLLLFLKKDMSLNKTCIYLSVKFDRQQRPIWYQHIALAVYLCNHFQNTYASQIFTKIIIFLIFQTPVPISYPCNVLPGEELMPSEHHCLEDISCTQGDLLRGNDNKSDRREGISICLYVFSSQ